MGNILNLPTYSSVQSIEELIVKSMQEYNKSYTNISTYGYIIFLHKKGNKYREVLKYLENISVEEILYSCLDYEEENTNIHLA